VYALINAFKCECVNVPHHVSVNGGFDPRAGLRSCLFCFTRENTFLDSPLSKTEFNMLVKGNTIRNQLVMVDV
jgi:hypothetical protein